MKTKTKTPNPGGKPGSTFYFRIVQHKDLVHDSKKYLPDNSLIVQSEYGLGEIKFPLSELPKLIKKLQAVQKEVGNG